MAAPLRFPFAMREACERLGGENQARGAGRIRPVEKGAEDRMFDGPEDNFEMTLDPVMPLPVGTGRGAYAPTPPPFHAPNPAWRPVQPQ